MGNITVNYEILQWARESSNFSLEDVASRMRKGIETVESWEEGKDSPTYLQLEKLAYQIYKRPIAVFFFPGPPKEDLPKKSFRTLPDVEFERLSPTFIRLFRQARAMQIKLSELCDGKNPADRKIFEDIQVTLQVNVNSFAETIREYLEVELEKQVEWKRTEEALSNWRYAIEKKGVFVFKEAFRQDEISGFCLYDSEFPIVYINNAMPWTRQIFTIFHELAHLFFRTGGIDKLRDDFMPSLSGYEREIEIFCNKFAGAFLVPKKDFDRQIIHIDDQSILALAERYSVSREVILRRLLDRGLVDEEYYNEKVNGWVEGARKYAGKTKGGNYYYTKVAYLGKYYLDLAFSKFDKKEISIYQLADYLNTRISNVSGLETALNR